MKEKFEYQESEEKLRRKRLREDDLFWNFMIGTILLAALWTYANLTR